MGEEFNKLVQDDSVLNYQEKIERSGHCCLLKIFGLSERYIIPCFISGFEGRVVTHC